MTRFIDTLYFCFNQSQLQQLTINLQPNPSFLTTEGSLHSRSHSTIDLILFCTTYIVSRRTLRKHIRCPAVCEPHRKHVFLYCLIYSALHSNGKYPIVAYVFAVAKCVYRAVVQQRVNMSQYILNLIFFIMCLSYIMETLCPMVRYYEQRNERRLLSFRM
jgi:hypothetical protein